MKDEFEVVAAEFRHESPPTKGSRFIAAVAPAETPEQAEAFVANMRAEAPDATHHCWAYRVGRPCDRFRFSDDGEPGGSAGRPILQQIEGHNLTDTVCVIRRWFGGTKLGVGGLMRAYGGAAARALDQVPRKTVLLMERFRVTVPYDCSSPVEALLKSRGLQPLHAEYGAEIRLHLEVACRDREAIERELRDRTSGRAVIEAWGSP